MKKTWGEPTTGVTHFGAPKRLSACGCAAVDIFDSMSLNGHSPVNRGFQKRKQDKTSRFNEFLALDGLECFDHGKIGKSICTCSKSGSSTSRSCQRTAAHCLASDERHLRRTSSAPWQMCCLPFWRNQAAQALLLSGRVRVRSGFCVVLPIPRCCMYGIFTYIWAIFGVNV